MRNTVIPVHAKSWLVSNVDVPDSVNEAINLYRECEGPNADVIPLFDFNGLANLENWFAEQRSFARQYEGPDEWDRFERARVAIVEFAETLTKAYGEFRMLERLTGRRND